MHVVPDPSNLSASSGRDVTTEVLTFLLADVRGYTRFTLEQGDEAAARLAAKFAAIAREVVSAHDGHVLELRGDEALAVFSSVRQALRAAGQLQERFAYETMADTTLPLRVGIGLDVGEAIPVEGGYRGAALNLAARLCSLAGPGEVLVSEGVTHLARKVEGLSYRERGQTQLKGFPEPVRVVQLVPEETGPEGSRARNRAAQAADLPSGTVTFLYTDIEGSTTLWQEHGALMPALLARHDALLRESIEAQQGVIFRVVGDGCCAAFARAPDALAAALEAQRALAAEQWEQGIALRVRMGLHSGVVEVREGDYVGHALNRVARLVTAGHGGQVLVSKATQELVQDHLVAGIELRDLGEHELKDLVHPEHLYQLVAPGLLDDFPPLKTLGGGREPALSLPIGGFLGALPSGELVGREPELAAAVAAVEAVIAGSGQLVLVAGEAGVGKTRLAQEITLRARNQGFLITTGSCYEPQQAVPFYPFLEALAASYAGAPAAVRGEVPRRWPQLGRLLPTARIPLPPPSPDSREEHQRLFWAVTGFLQAIAETMPVALLLDDLHWADGSSLDLLQHVVRHTRAYRVLVLGTYRDVEVDRHHPLERVLLDLERQHLVERIALRRLRLDGTAALVTTTIGTGDVSRELADLLHRQTEGNPFFIQQVLRALIERGDVYRQNGHWTLREVDEIEVPESVRAVIGQRVARLGETAQDVLYQASVLGQAFAFDDLLALRQIAGADAPIDEEELEEALEEAVHAGLLRETSRDGYGFNHALTQHALHSELSQRRRRRLHLAAGEALERLSGQARHERASELAWHFLEGRDPQRALPYTILVGDRAEASFAHGDAARYYRTALELAQQLADRPREAEVRDKLGGLLTATIRYPEALEMLEQAAQLYRALEDREAEGRVIAQIGRVHFANGTTDQGIARLQTALEGLDGAGAVHLSAGALAGMKAALSHLLFARDRYDESLEMAQQAADLARSGGTAGVLAEAEVRRGSALPMLGHWQEGLRALQEATRAAEATGDLFSLCRGLQYLSGVELARGELALSRQSMERALQVAERMANRRQIATTTYGLGIHAFLAGDSQQAGVLAERALEGMHALGGFWLSVLQSAGLSLALTAGEWEAAPWHLKECITISERSGPLPGLRSERLLAEQELLAGRAGAALARLRRLLDHPGLEEQKAVGVLPLLVQAYLETGDQTRAEELIMTGLERARDQDLRLGLMRWLQVQGTLRSRQGRWDEAESAFGESVALARDMPYPYAEACGLYERGLMYVRMVDVGTDREQLLERARELLMEALAIFRQLGAQRDAERAEQAVTEVSSGGSGTDRAT